MANQKYSDPRKFDQDNFRRYLSNRRYMSLRFGTAFIFGITMIQTLLSIIDQFNIAYTIVLGVISFIALCFTLYATFTFMFVYKTYQDKTEITKKGFSSPVINTIKYLSAVCSTISLVIAIVLESLKSNSNNISMLVASIVVFILTIAMFINLTKMVDEQDRFYKLSNKLNNY